MSSQPSHSRQETASQLSSRITDQAQARLLDLAEEARAGLARSMNGLVISAHNLAANIDSMAGAPAGDLARTAAEVIGSLQQGLAEKPLPELLEDGRDLVRSQPAIAMGAAVAAGFLLAQLLSASSKDTDA